LKLFSVEFVEFLDLFSLFQGEEVTLSRICKTTTGLIVPHLLRWTQELCFGVRQLAAALNRVELPPRQLAAVVPPQQETGHRELLPLRPRIYCASKLARGNFGTRK
jgi:hypothetical protein